METKSLFDYLKAKQYPGRGLVAGRSADGLKAVAAYFIMGRSENSRNRIFVEDGEGLRTQAFDASKLTDPSLIIYSPVRVLRSEAGVETIVTNGDQTDTIFDGMRAGLTFEQSLRSRRYEPDAPNYTPRISCVLSFPRQAGRNFEYSLSILKSEATAAKNEEPSCSRQFFSYENPAPGFARLLHTYEEDGEPLPSFEGEPKCFSLGAEAESIDSFAAALWQSLNEAHKVALFVRFVDLASGQAESRLVNKLK